MITLFVESKNDNLLGSTCVEIKLAAAWTSYLLLTSIPHFYMNMTWVGFYEKQKPV